MTGSGNSDTVELIALPIFYRDNTSSFCIELIFHFVLFRVNTKVLAFSPHTDHSIYRLVISLVTFVFSVYNSGIKESFLCLRKVSVLDFSSSVMARWIQYVCMCAWKERSCR